MTKDFYTKQLASLRTKFAPVVGSDPVGILNLKYVPSASVPDDPKNPEDIVCVATTDFTDLDSEVVVPDGADMSYFLQNNNIFVDHEYDMAHTVAKRRSVVPFPDAAAVHGWRVRCSLIKGMPYADMVRTLAREGTLGCSIGMQAIDYGSPSPDEKKKYPGARSVVRRWKWLELSFTSMPCNMECRVMMSGGDFQAAKSVRRIVVV